MRVPYRGRVILERRPGRGLPQRLHVGGILVRRGLGRHPLVLRPMSAMRDTMATQPSLLRKLLADGGPAEAAAGAHPRPPGAAGRHRHELACRQPGRMAPAGRRGRGVGRPGRRRRRPRAATGSRRRARAPEPPRHQALHEHRPRAGAGRRAPRRSSSRGAEHRAPTSRRAIPRPSAAFTASHLGALMRVAQIAVALGADLGRLEQVPDAVEAVLDAPGPGVDPPERLLEFVGAGAEPVDGRRGRAQGARDVLRRDRGALGRAAPAWPVGGAPGGRHARRR